MATGIGKTFVHSEHRSDQREIYYARCAYLSRGLLAILTLDSDEGLFLSTTQTSTGP